MARHLILPPRGPLLVSPDLHGNGEDFRRLRAIFLELRSAEPAAHWVLLGDLVHGPDEKTRREEPRLYGFLDESFAIVEGVAALRAEHAGYVHLLLGNHDHGHVGGAHTSRFHRDEVRFLEESLEPAQRALLRTLFEEASLLALAPCGILLCHGSPGTELRDPVQVDRLSLRPEENEREGARLLLSLLTSYGQAAAVTEGVLRRLSESTGLELGLLVQGHERDEAGWFSDGPHQICPVLFGAPRGEKRYLLLDLAARYPDASAIREGVELRRLYPEPTSS